VGMSQRELLGDHSAHRDAENMRAFDLRRIQHRRCIVSHLRDRICSGGNIAFPHAAIVEGDGPVMLGENRASAMPHFAGIAAPHDQEQRVTRVRIIPIDAGSITGRVRHALQCIVDRQ